MKILQYKLNAVMAKSRAIYGRRLTEKDYDALVSCASVSEITSYLKASPSYYSDVLGKLSSTDISAGHLEFLIKKSESDIFSGLCRYEMAFGQEMYNYFIKKSEIRAILLQISNIISGRTDAELIKNRFVDVKTDIDFYALSASYDFDALSKLLDGTAYEKVFESCRKNSKNDYFSYECAFLKWFREYEYDLVKKCCGKNSSLLKLLSEKADTEFIDMLFRAKKYFSSYNSYISDIAPLHLTMLTKNEISALLSSDSEKAMLDVLDKTHYRAYSAKIRKENYPEGATAQLNYEKYKHTLRFSREPDEVMFCFMFLIENEVSNLVHIIEGVKYGIDASGIREMLIGAGD